MPYSVFVTVEMAHSGCSRSRRVHPDHKGLMARRSGADVGQKSPTGPAGALLRGPSPSLGPVDGPCCAIAQTCFCIFSVFLWPVLSRSAIAGEIPHLAELASTYLIILISDWPKLAISLQASSGGCLAVTRGLDQPATFLRLFAQGGKPLHAGIGPTARRKRRGCTKGSQRRRTVRVRDRRSVAGGRFGLPRQRRGKRCLRECLPGVKGDSGEGQRHNQADHQGGFSGKILRPDVFRSKQGSDYRHL